MDIKTRARDRVSGSVADRIAAGLATVIALGVLAAGLGLPAAVASTVVWVMLALMVFVGLGWRRLRRPRQWPGATPALAIAAFMAVFAVLSGPQLVASSAQHTPALVVGLIGATALVTFLRWATPPEDGVDHESRYVR